MSPAVVRMEMRRGADCAWGPDDGPAVVQEASRTTHVMTAARVSLVIVARIEAVSRRGAEGAEENLQDCGRVRASVSCSIPASSPPLRGTIMKPNQVTATV